MLIRHYVSVSGWNPPGVTRIRYPQIFDMRRRLPLSIFTLEYDDANWFDPVLIQVRPSLMAYTLD